MLSSVLYSSKDQDNNSENYIKSRFHCVDIFDEYVTSLKRQHGVIRNAASDPPNFDPGISVSHSRTKSRPRFENIFFLQITGPQVKKDPSIIDKEDSRTVKKMIGIEPRKKYALVHEDIGIFIIGE